MQTITIRNRLNFKILINFGLFLAYLTLKYTTNATIQHFINTNVRVLMDIQTENVQSFSDQTK